MWYNGNGNFLAVINPEDCPEFMEDQKRRAANPEKRYSFAQVRNHLRALEEAWNREGGFDGHFTHAMHRTSS